MKLFRLLKSALKRFFFQNHFLSLQMHYSCSDLIRVASVTWCRFESAHRPLNHPLQLYSHSELHSLVRYCCLHKSKNIWGNYTLVRQCTDSLVSRFLWPFKNVSLVLCVPHSLCPCVIDLGQLGISYVIDKRVLRVMWKEGTHNTGRMYAHFVFYSETCILSISCPPGVCKPKQKLKCC